MDRGEPVVMKDAGRFHQDLGYGGGTIRDPEDMALEPHRVGSDVPSEGMRGQGGMEIGVHRHVCQDEEEEKHQRRGDPGFAHDHRDGPKEEEAEEPWKPQGGGERWKKVGRIEAEEVYPQKRKERKAKDLLHLGP